MTDREWLRALRNEIARMADDAETQRQAYMNLIARSEDLAADLDRTSAALERTTRAYEEIKAELQRVNASLTWRLHERLIPGRSRLRTEHDAMTKGPYPGVSRETPYPDSSNVAPKPSEWEPTPGPDPAGTPAVSVIVPTRDRPDLLGPLLAMLARTEWTPLEVILVDNGTTDPEALDLLAHSGHMVVSAPGPFNFPALIDVGVRASSGEVLVLLNNDIEGDDPNWLHALIACLDTPGCGIAGALLLYPDGSIQHAGLDFEGGEPRHAFAGQWPGEIADDLLAAPRTCPAVTGACLAIRRSTWDELGGLEPIFARNYNDVDLCLRAAEAGFTTMITPHACLVHNESATRGTAWDPELSAEGVLFRARWMRP
jgi:GT2 family glycosyltransferase